jgi:hypothetical protein
MGGRISLHAGIDTNPNRKTGVGHDRRAGAAQVPVGHTKLSSEWLNLFSIILA